MNKRERTMLQTYVKNMRLDLFYVERAVTDLEYLIEQCGQPDSTGALITPRSIVRRADEIRAGCLGSAFAYLRNMQHAALRLMPKETEPET